MLYAFFISFADKYTFLKIFDYITFRAVFACLTSILLGLSAGPYVIRKLTELKVGQAVRAYGPKEHLAKKRYSNYGWSFDPYIDCY